MIQVTSLESCLVWRVFRDLAWSRILWIRRCSQHGSSWDCLCPSSGEKNRRSPQSTAEVREQSAWIQDLGLGQGLSGTERLGNETR
eukprot:scaffold1387_cov260-Pinguiococcus_pyrenoidosus.AAC.10